ncbi:hypothetical protein BDV10DRAFT_169471 [Aspergillus recurvatus]
MQMSMAYQGGCHCGTAKFTFTLPAPLGELEVVKHLLDLHKEWLPGDISQSLGYEI